MAKYKLTNKAVEDLTKIWEYTLENWSENQANKYYNLLIETCQYVAENPNLGKNYDGITPDLLGIKSNSHIIFYRRKSNISIEIIRILHERMDLKNRIIEK